MSQTESFNDPKSYNGHHTEVENVQIGVICYSLFCTLGKSLYLSNFTFTFHFQGSLTWRREWQPTLVFLPGEFHGQRSLAGCSPQESDMTEELTHTHIRQLESQVMSICFISVTFCHTVKQGVISPFTQTADIFSRLEL